MIFGWRAFSFFYYVLYSVYDLKLQRLAQASRWLYAHVRFAQNAI